MTHFARICPNLYMYSKHLAGVEGKLEIVGFAEKVVVTFAKESGDTLRADDK